MLYNFIYLSLWFRRHFLQLYYNKKSKINLTSRKIEITLTELELNIHMEYLY